MNKRQFIKKLYEATWNVNESMTANDGSAIARGLSREGYAGGYYQALLDVDAIIRDITPSDPRGYWKK